MAFNQKDSNSKGLNSAFMNAIAENGYFIEKGMWKKFVRDYLELTEREIATIQSNYEREGVMEVRYQHLEKWKHISGYSATEKRLQNLFEKLKNDRHRSRNQQPQSDERSGDGIRVSAVENRPVQPQPTGVSQAEAVQVSQPEQEQQPEVSVRDMRENSSRDVREESTRVFCEPVAETELKAAALPVAPCAGIPKGEDVYSTQEKCKGKVLIINNSFAETKYMREGSDKDLKNMKSLWESLKFQVFPVQNKNKSDLIRELQKFKDILTKDDIAVVFTMSHGYQKGMEEYVFTNDCESVKKNDLIAHFNGDNLSKLINRPKLFFFQMCRGNEANPGVEVPLEQNTNPSWVEDSCDAMTPGTLHPNADMLICDSTQTGERAFRNIDGSWFINAIYHVFSQYAASEHVEELMTKVNRAVASKTSYAPSDPILHNRKVICDKHSKLRYKLYLR